MVDLLGVKIASCGYPGGFELRNIVFSLKKGDVLLVTGRSSCGKTTLLRAITGTIVAAGGYLDGKVLLEGRNILELKPSEVYRSVAYVPQEPWYAFVGHTVYAEVCHHFAQLGVNCAEDHFVPLGVFRLANRLTYTLSAGEMRRVLLLETILGGAKLVVLDEPLTYLDEEARRSVKRYVKVAREAEAGVIIADHDPLHWEFLEPNMLVLDSGEIKYFGRWSRALVEEARTVVQLKKHEGKRAERGAFVKFKNVSFRYPGGEVVIKGFTESFQRGVLTCITGPNSSGKTTILKLGAGLLQPTIGVVERYGSAVYVPENTSLYFSMPTPFEELYALVRDESKVLEVAEVLKIKHVLNRPVTKLSTSERRKAALASAYLLDLDGYFIDEPVDGLDDESACAVFHALQVLLERDKAVVAATHDKRLIGLSDVVIQLS